MAMVIDSRLNNLDFGKWHNWSFDSQIPIHQVAEAGSIRYALINFFIRLIYCSSKPSEYNLG